MGRNTAKYAYTIIGIPLAGGVASSLRQEAEQRGVPYATHISDLLVDRHAALHGGEGSTMLWFPRGGSFSPSPPFPRREMEEKEKIDETHLEDNIDAFFALNAPED